MTLETTGIAMIVKPRISKNKDESESDYAQWHSKTAIVLVIELINNST